MKNICIVCGYKSSQNFFNENSSEPNWNHNLCDCCGFEYGIDETAFGRASYVDARNEWISNGSRFINNQLWDSKACIEQLKNLKLVKIEDLPEWVKDINKDWSPTVDEKLVLAKFGKP